MPFRPEFFDIFGVGVFGFITALATWALAARKAMPQWALVLLLAIGLAGLIVDGAIVYNTYIK